MFLQTIRSKGLAHLSYLLGDGDEAFVIDPRRDCGKYVEHAYRHQARITHIFETHRHEDFISGACELAARTGATIHHGRAYPFGFGEPVDEGAEFYAGNLRLTVLQTPGHTDESLSFVLFHLETDTRDPLAVFTGDALFVGGTGRTDFYPEHGTATAEALYDSIVGKLLPLGDHTLLLPAHTAGSACGATFAHRKFSTLGYERRHNPALRLDRNAFIHHKLNEHHYMPPYFAQMERINGAGPAILGRWPTPQPASAKSFSKAMADGALALDVREPEAVAGALIRGSLAIPLSMLPGFAGWFLPYDRDLILIAHDYSEVKATVTCLVRLGYERVTMWLGEALHGWEVTGQPYATVPAVHALELKARLESKRDFTLLDVRGRAEVAEAALPGATEIYLGELPSALDHLPGSRPITTFCGSGRRSIVAASILLAHGFANVEICLGSMAACRAVGCPIRTTP